MGLSVNNNIAALNAYRNLSTTQSNLSKSLEKLSSGFRINRAADDAAGLAISEGLRSQVGGLTQASRNAQDGISVVQTAEGALNEVHSVLQRLRNLAVQGANDSNSTNARAAITTEATSLTAELTRISASTNFNGTKLLDGSAGTLNFQVGADGTANSQIGVDLSTANIANVATTLNTNSGGTAFAIATPTLVTGNLAFTAGSATATVAMGAAGSYNTVAEVAAKLNNDSGFASGFQASVDSTNNLVVRSTTGVAVATTAPGTGAAAGAVVAGGIQFDTAAHAQAAISALDTQINYVSTARAGLGAMQNRLEHTINNVNVAVENLTASESRIRDTDMASEMVKFTGAQILSQAGTAMLAQANQLPQGVLKLLG
jgi:flagellin